MRRLAAVDVGSTSVHVLVADVSAGSVAAVHDESAFLGLSAVGQARGLLGGQVSVELVDLLGRYAVGAREAGAADVVVVCTAPCRRARDAAWLVRRVERDLGLALHVLTAREEALLTLLGVASGAPATGHLAVVDVGGGSTEVITALSGTPVRVEALDVGAATLAARHAVTDPPSPEEVAAMLAEARGAVAGLAPARARAAVAVGGTADNVLRVARVGGDEAARRLTRPALVAAIEAVTMLPADAVAARFGVRPARARLLPAGAAILLALLDRWGLEEVAVSAAGLREGAILARSRAGAAWRDRLEHLAGGARD